VDFDKHVNKNTIIHERKGYHVMARVLMGRARFKIQRRLGIELPGLGKSGALERRPYPPGQHGVKRKKVSELSVRWMEKQKVLFHYGLREKQLVNYVKKAKKDRSKAWVDTLIVNLESRLDNVLFRLSFAPSMPAARQMVVHGHVLVNGKKVSSPGQLLEVGDKVTLTDKGYNSGNYLQAKAHPRMSSVPACLSKDTVSNKEVATVIATPLPEDVPFEFSPQLVIEFYWRVK